MASQDTPTAQDDRATILVVDDTPENLAVLGTLLSPDYRVRAAKSGERALEIAVSAPQPDLILLDVMMADMDGYMVLKRLQENPQTRDIPVIFVTSMDSSEDEEKGLDLGAEDYITKPLKPAVVMARVRTHLELKRIRDTLKRHNANLEAEIERRMAENQLIQDVTINALAHLAEIRDNDTGNHLYRTHRYVLMLAEGLAALPKYENVLDPAKVRLLGKSAPLHDIGKVGIPDQILLKPGKLTPEEWTIMKTHAALGAQAIEMAERDAERSIPFLEYAKQIARYHHERWNGSGYPEGLRGEEIPLAARLMALADVFDALISKRCYKEAMEFDEVRAIILSERGRHFDPDIVDIFIASYEAFCQIARDHRDST